jgi:hypothetical protein
LAKAGEDLIALYLKFENMSGASPSATAAAARIEVVGSSVRIDVHGTGDLSGLSSALASLGMQVSTTDSSTKTIEGLLPIAQLVNAAQLPQTVGISPVFKPSMN